MKNTKPSLAQQEAFVRVARELGCDESEEAFTAVVKKVARARAKGIKIGETMKAGSAKQTK